MSNLYLYLFLQHFPPSVYFYIDTSRKGLLLTHLPKQIVMCTSSFHQNFNALTAYSITYIRVTKVDGGDGGGENKAHVEARKIKEKYFSELQIPLDNAAEKLHPQFSFVPKQVQLSIKSCLQIIWDQSSSTGINKKFKVEYLFWQEEDRC